MELIIAMVLFIALVACWIVLPGSIEETYALHTSEPLSGRPVRRTTVI